MRFTAGLAQKVILADTLAAAIDPVFNPANASSVTATRAWIAVLLYPFQIFFDFNGYCDMARGFSQALGISLPENSNRPFRAVSITDCRQRRHVTLLLTFVSFASVFFWASDVSTAMQVFRGLAALHGTGLGALWTLHDLFPTALIVLIAVRAAVLGLWGPSTLRVALAMSGFAVLALSFANTNGPTRFIYARF